jgi:hypothetical protein
MGQGMWHTRQKEEETRFLGESVMEGSHVEDVGEDGRIILERILE